jgi:phosphate starvation-inducible PhoH-like protein
MYVGMEKKDTSPKVHQRDKVEATFKVKALKWTPKQKIFIDTALNRDTKIMFLNGPAGTGKSLLAVYCALRMLTERKVSDIIYIRSAVESSDSKLGFLPGDADQKLHFYNLPFAEKMQELLSPRDIKKLEADERVSMYPVNYARGMSWNAKCIIFDEVQNSSRKEIITVLTRLGMFCKCFVLADPMQTDLPTQKGGAIKKIHKLFSDEESTFHGIKTFEFNEDDIMRSELVKYLVKKFKEM